MCTPCCVLHNWLCFGVDEGFEECFRVVSIHFVWLLFTIWDCEPLFFVLKTIVISCLWFGTCLMRITGARLVFALEEKPKSRVRVTIVQLMIGASLCLRHRCILRSILNKRHFRWLKWLFGAASLWIFVALWHLEKDYEKSISRCKANE